MFGAYADSYDALYSTKDYGRECDVLEDLFRRYFPEKVGRVLDLGCGTGGHALRMAARGYHVTGIDRSPAMLTEARRKAHESGQVDRTHFEEGDVRSFSVRGTFEAAVAMFAVMSYLPKNIDHEAALASVRRHLVAGGLFVFDVWFGPGVLHEPPADRFKVVTDGETEIVRLATPRFDLLSQSVDVTYRVLRRKGDQLVGDVTETHRMRFFFPQELELLVRAAGFELVSLHQEGSPDRPAGPEDWQVGVVARAV
jgi:SAM-dependent methyltransferase